MVFLRAALAGFILGLFVAPVAGRAQDDIVWLQISAQPSRALAEARAEDLATQLPDLAGFELGGNWHGVMMGPYLRSTAELVRDQLLAQGVIPYDTFLVLPDQLGPQFWPPQGMTTQVTTLALDSGPTPPADEADPAPAAATLLPPSEAPSPQPLQAAPLLVKPTPVATVAEPASPDPVLPDETPQQARASEAALTQEEKKELQRALAVDGFYTAGIDGAFGPGTRRAMAGWQAAQGLEPTGILTTDQRAQVLAAFYAPLKSVGMRRVEDRASGIALDLPLGVVAFEGHDWPFARFRPTGDLAGAEVWLISQTGDRTRLKALFEVIQTLPPLSQPSVAQLRRGSFVIEAPGTTRVAHAEARIGEDGIKGFVLIWPQGDEPRRLRVLGAMQAGFERIGGQLPDVSLPGGGAELAVEIRYVQMARSGVVVSGQGHVMTTSQVVQGCGVLQLSDGTELTEVAQDARLGVSLLAPAATADGGAVAAGLAQQSLGDGAVLAVAGFPLEGVSAQASLGFGALGQRAPAPGVIPLDMAHLNGEVGGPVLDETGAVHGILLPGLAEGTPLPDGVSVAADASVLAEVMRKAGLTPEPAGENAPLPVARLGAHARSFTVLVQCLEPSR